MIARRELRSDAEGCVWAVRVGFGSQELQKGDWWCLRRVRVERLPVCEEGESSLRARDSGESASAEPTGTINMNRSADASLDLPEASTWRASSPRRGQSLSGAMLCLQEGVCARRGCACEGLRTY